MILHRSPSREPIPTRGFESLTFGFADRAAAFLAATGCAQPERHAAQLLAVLDGIVVAEFHGEDATLGHDAISELIERQIASC